MPAQGSRNENPGVYPKMRQNPEGFAIRRTLSGFNRTYVSVPKVVAGAPNLGLKLANAFGVVILYWNDS